MTIGQIWRPSTARRLTLDEFRIVPRGVMPMAPSAMTWPAKDPEDVLDYEIDIGPALVGNESDCISSVSAKTFPSGDEDVKINSIIADGQVVVFWISGGVSGTTYLVQVTIATNTGRTLGRAVMLPVMSLKNSTVPTGALTTDQGSVITDQTGNPILIGS